jgi:hypothetical protein
VCHSPQNDFFKGGSVALQDADAVVPVINSLRKRRFDVVLYCTLERSLNYSGFASNNPVRLGTTCRSVEQLLMRPLVQATACNQLRSLPDHLSGHGDIDKHQYSSTRPACSVARSLCPGAVFCEGRPSCRQTLSHSHCAVCLQGSIGARVRHGVVTKPTDIHVFGGAHAMKDNGACSAAGCACAPVRTFLNPNAVEYHVRVRPVVMQTRR